MNDDFSRELLTIIDETFTLMRQEIVTLRNDLAQHKLEFVRANHDLNSLKKSEDKRHQLSVSVVVALIAASASVVGAVLVYMKH